MLTCLVGSGVALLCGRQLYQSMALINEPEPSTFDRQRIVSILKTRGIDVRVDRVLYVYLDVTSFVFEGKVKNIDQSSWHVSRGGSLWTLKPKGIVILQESKSGAGLIGFCDQSIDFPIEPHFKKHFEEYRSPKQRIAD